MLNLKKECIWKIFLRFSEQFFQIIPHLYPDNQVVFEQLRLDHLRLLNVTNLYSNYRLHLLKIVLNEVIIQQFDDDHAYYKFVFNK